MKKINLLAFFILFSIQSFSQSYSGPESAEFDYANRRWLIGNTTTHQVLSRDSLGNLTVLIANTVSGPYGIEIMGDTLYCCVGASIRGYLLSTGAQVFSIATGGSFLNGLTHDDSGNLITTDFSAKKIFKINPAANTLNTIATGLTASPNGIVFDSYNNRCVFVSWGSNVTINAIDLSTNSITPLISTSLSNCDGITRDGQGRYYVSNWGLQSVIRYDSLFATPPTTVASSLSNPADIFYNVVDDTLAIPNAGNNTVRFVGFASTVSVPSINTMTNLSVYPNPATQGEIIRIESNNQAYQLSDATGKIVLENITSDIPTAALPKGIYFLKPSNASSVVQRIIIQ